MTEPRLVTLEGCNRFFIVEQRWVNLEKVPTFDGLKIKQPGPEGYGVSPLQTATHTVPFAYIFQPMAGPYARVYREWVRNDNRRAAYGRPASMFAFIVEARTKRQVAKWLQSEGYITEWNNRPFIPEDRLWLPGGGQGGATVAFGGGGGGYSVTVHSTGGGGGGGSMRPTISAGSVPVINVNYSNKEQEMNRDVKRRNLERIISRAMDDLAKIEAFPDEPIPSLIDGGADEGGTDASVVFFGKRFSPGGQVYTYAAVKADGLWYTTGPRGGGVGRTWDDLVEWVLEGDEGNKIYAARRFKALS